MVEISNIEVSNLESSIFASGYPMQDELIEEPFEKAMKRALGLAKQPSNSGHGNFLKGITVAYDIKYPQYFSPQLQRYIHNVIVSSQSKMHRLKSMGIRKCCTKYVDERAIALALELQSEYNRNPTYVNYMKLLNNLPMGFELVMRCTTNYMALKNIYNQRKHHKLKEDWVDGFIGGLIYKLPYKELII
ncbi:MAG: hypothetical protein ACRC9P_05730 [Bacteroides sp.]